MAEKETTPPPTGADIDKSPMTPAAKRVRMTSPPKAPAQATDSTLPAQGRSNTTGGETVGNTIRVTVGEDHVEEFDDAEEDRGSLYDGDSAFGTDSSDTTSISSSIYAGYMENGRKYQTVREGEYWGPSDEKQMETMEAVHVLHLILDNKQKNQLFHSPIPDTAQNILDLGTGSGAWCRDVADTYPSAVVTGVDLSPPPDTWVPPNVRFEVDDILKEWTFRQSFDLVHLRWLMGAFTPKQWHNVYRQSYHNLLPGGYLEHMEAGVTMHCDDGTLPADSLMAGWGPNFNKVAATTGKPLDTVDTMRAAIENAGFINVREKVYKVPVGDWAKNPILKEAGRVNKAQLLQGMEGYGMYLLTKFGLPEPWSPEQVQVYLAKVRKEINTGGYHTYFIFRRVWAQKPPLPANSKA